MDRAVPALNLPITSAGCAEIRLSFDGLDMIVDYEYCDAAGTYMVGTIVFEGVTAFKWNSEFQLPLIASGSTDNVVRLRGSGWIGELLKRALGEDFGSARGKEHFAVFFTNNGYLELVARQVVDRGTRPGELRPS